MLQPGQVFNNRYKIISTLGEGGFGAVYKVWDDNLQRFCAIKENLQVSAESQKQFRREAIMLANLNHPHLVRVTDYFIISDQGQYLVMDYVDGIDLHTALINYGKALPLVDTLRWTLQICDALIYIHSQNPPIIHRDIKPANIRITPQNNAVLVDFGLAKAFEANAKTSTGARGLTPIFASPEQYGMGGTDAQSDIYSLGVTLYCMLTNHVPADSVDIMVGNAEPPPPAKAINRDIPECVSDALQRAMQIRRTDRYKSAGDFKTALLAEQKSLVAKPSSLVNDTTLEKNLNNQAPNPALTAHKDKEDIFRKKILMLRKQNRLKEAEEVCRTAIIAYPTSVDLYITLDEILKKQHLTIKGRLKEIEQVHRTVIDINPANAQVCIDFGIFLEEQDRMKEAEKYYYKAITAEPTYTEAYDCLGVFLLNQNRIEEAEQIYRKSIDINPTYAMSYGRLGGILEEQNHMKEAEEFYRKAISHDPNFSTNYNALGFLLYRQNRIQEAEEAYHKAIIANSKDDLAYFNLGVLLGKQNRVKEAEEAYRKAIAADPLPNPTSAKVYNNLGNLLKAQNRISESEEAYRNAASFRKEWGDLEARFGR